MTDLEKWQDLIDREMWQLAGSEAFWRIEEEIEGAENDDDRSGTRRQVA